MVLLMWIYKLLAANQQTLNRLARQKAVEKVKEAPKMAGPAEIQMTIEISQVSVASLSLSHKGRDYSGRRRKNF